MATDSSRSNGAFTKTLCSICYEDLKPIVEDLQTINICGHVFHELCIQQWFEYCPKGKKRNCPVCKQNCPKDSVFRLYFQSVGDSASTQKPTSFDENPVELQIEVEKLKGKVIALSSALERQQKDAKVLSEELCVNKELAKKESETKNEVLLQKASLQQLLSSKLKELDRSTLERAGLQERNMALAKELAALKLACDFDLEEGEVLKLVSFGNEANNQDKIDVLKRTLVLRNKSYKELMAKCNEMGRGEARSLRKLKKKKEKIKKLKSRIQELEKAAEEKENDVLRALKKASKRASCEEGIQNDVRFNLNSSFMSKGSNSRVFEPFNLDDDETEEHLFSPNKTKKFKFCNDKAATDPSPTAFNEEIGLDNAANYENATEFSRNVNKTFVKSLIVEDNVDPRKNVSSQKEAPALKSEDKVSVTFENGDSVNNAVTIDDDDDEVLILDNIKQVESFTRTDKENSYPASIAQPGDVCFSGGLLAPDGTLRHLGKWCKRAQSRASVSAAQGSNTSSGNLIAVGADGRGGKIKVLRSVNSSSESRETTPLTKRCKLGAKSSNLQSRGCFQIEHFFGKTSQ